jgi:hypothetical protein
MVEARELYIAAADFTAYVLQSQEGYAVDPRPRSERYLLF